jgi:hypothetical protein
MSNGLLPSGRQTHPSPHRPQGALTTSLTLSTTAIYADAVGAEELTIMSRFGIKK